VTDRRLAYTYQVRVQHIRDGLLITDFHGFVAGISGVHFTTLNELRVEAGPDGLTRLLSLDFSRTSSSLAVAHEQPQVSQMFGTPVR